MILQDDSEGPTEEGGPIFLVDLLKSFLVSRASVLDHPLFIGSL